MLKNTNEVLVNQSIDNQMVVQCVESVMKKSWLYNFFQYYNDDSWKQAMSILRIKANAIRLN